MTDRPDSGRRGSRTAGAFDIRSFIALLLAIYGIVLVLAGIFASDAALEKAGGVNVNLWTGLALLVAAGALQLWARLRPVIVPPDPGGEQRAADDAADR